MKPRGSKMPSKALGFKTMDAGDYLGNELNSNETNLALTQQMASAHSYAKAMQKFMLNSKPRNFKVNTLNQSLDYEPLVGELKKLNEKSPDNGLLVPHGNPYQVSMNSEVLLIQNKHQIEHDKSYNPPITPRFKKAMLKNNLAKMHQSVDFANQSSTALGSYTLNQQSSVLKDH